MAYEYVYKRRRMLDYHRYSIPQGATKIRKVDARSKKYAYLKSSRYGFLIMKRKRRLYKNKNQSQRKAVMAKPKIYRVYAKPNMTTVTPRLAYDIPAKNALEAKKKVITISKRYYKNTNAKPKDLIAKRIK